MRLAPALLAVALLSLVAVAEDKKPKEGEGKPDPKTLEHIKRTEELRGLKFETNPKVGYWSVDKLKKMMVADFDEEMPEEKAKSITTVMVKFGLLPKDYDLRQEYLDVMLEQIAGFYHPKKKILCLIQGKSGTGMEEEIVIIHELNHALQDQNFDLTRLQDLTAKNDDMSSALKALIEGEATMVMFDHVMMQQAGTTSDQVPGIEGIIEAQMKSGGGGPGAEKLAKAPPIIRESLLSSYIDGFKWCVGLKRAKGWAGLNAAWEDLPVSTEQILHPDRYTQRDMPQTVTLPKTIDSLQGWDTVEENVMGEFGTKMIFLTLKPKSPKTGAAAAEGWDGDTYRVYQKGEDVLLTWATTWDTEVDAREFAVAYTKILKKKYEHLKDQEAKGETFSHESEAGQIMLTREGKNVFIVEGGTEEEATGAMEAMEKGTKMKEMKPGFGAKEK